MVVVVLFHFVSVSSAMFVVCLFVFCLFGWVFFIVFCFCFCFLFLFLFLFLFVLFVLFLFCFVLFSTLTVNRKSNLLLWKSRSFKNKLKNLEYRWKSKFFNVQCPIIQKKNQLKVELLENLSLSWIFAENVMFLNCLTLRQNYPPPKKKK